MSTEPRDRLARLLRAARLHPPEERTVFLDAACADDPALRRQLNDLLQKEVDETVLLPDIPTSVASSLLSYKAVDESGRQVGPYTVERLLGQGGMGDVYLARREAPFKRYVALKIIRREMASRDALQRFSMERQILASLDHANIARLLDGGVTEDGRPFFAMEYVEGLPLAAYCDKYRLPVEKRLRLFQTVCQAVHYAHQNLVLHRDLKPSNILVTQAGQVKLLDFGIAKLLNPSMSPLTLPVTRTELRLMTPEYASPEQVRGDTLTTGSDVYALGVLLYELLTGHRPYRLATHSTEEVLRIICEQEPQRPSTKVTQTEEVTRSDGSSMRITPEEVGAARAASVERLKRRLEGDLDNIVLMALRKEAPRRYASAEQFSEDLQRYLDGLPVVARPSTLGYRLKKFSQRHRAAVGSALLAGVALLIGLGVALWQAGAARQERDRAGQALVQAEEALLQSREVTDFLIDLFEASDPSQAQGEEITAREVLEAGVDRVEALAGQPPVQAQLLDAMGRVYQRLGRYDRAEGLLDSALVVRKAYAGEVSAEASASLAHTADLFRVKGNYAEAEERYREALATQQALLGPRHPDVLESLIGLGQVLQDKGDFEGAEPIFREVLTLQQEALGAEQPEVVRTQGRLAQVLHGKGDYDAAETVLQQTLALREKLYGEFHPEVAENLIQLGSLYATRDDDFARSETFHRRALEIREKLYGSAHPAVAKSLTYVGNSLVFQDRFEEAEPLLRRAIAVNRDALGPAHPDVGTALNTLALLYEEQQAYDEAEVLFREALTAYQLAFGKEHHYTAAIIGNLAGVARARGDLRTAEALFRQGLALRTKALGEGHPYVVGTQRQLADVLRQALRFAEAERLYTEALEHYGRRTDSAVEQRQVYGALAALYAAWGKPEEAARYKALYDQGVDG